MLGRIEQGITPGERTATIIEPLFRVLTSLIFIIAGKEHFGQHKLMLERMEGSPWASRGNMIGALLFFSAREPGAFALDGKVQS